MGKKTIVAVIGDGHLKSDDPKLEISEKLGTALVDNNFRVACGGMSGVMAAVCRGAKSSRIYQSGDTIGLVPGHDPSVANEWVDIPIATGLDVARNAIVGHADAVIAVGGGAGTLSEMCFAWMFQRLVIGLEVDGWSGRLAGQALDHRMRYPSIPNDQVWAAQTANDAVNILIRELPRYNRTNSPLE